MIPFKLKTLPSRTLILFFALNFWVLLSLVHCQNVNLHLCCPPNFKLNSDNGTCSDEPLVGESQVNGVLELPEFLSMSAYPEEIRKLNFSLKDYGKPPSCSNGEFQRDVSLRNSTDSPVNFTVEGYLKIGKDYYAPNEYCVDRLNRSEGILSVFICNATCNDRNPCIKRCCDFGQVWDLRTLGKPGGKLLCKSSGLKQWLPALYYDPYTPLDSSENLMPHYISDHPKNGWCDPRKSVMLSLTSKYNKDDKVLFRVLKDGSIVQKLRALTWEPIHQNDSCIDGAQNFPGHFDESDPGFYTGEPSDTMILDCRPRIPVKIPISKLYRIAMIIACVFLLLTITVYLLLFHNQNAHGWTLLCYLTSLLFMYISLCLMNFSKELNFTLAKNTGGGGDFCFIISISIHFFLLCSFCFLTTINFDLWWTFRALKPAGKSKGLKRFLIYLAFALGIPICILSVALALDFSYRDDIESNVIVPLYGRTRCYMEKHSQLVYVYIPVGVLISLNLLFFIFTIYSMYKIQVSTKFASNSSSKTNKQNQSAKLFIKLFVVMGVSWVSEVISWTVSEDQQVSWYFVIFDMINIFQSVAIFIIFACKRDTLAALRQRHPKLRTFISLITKKPEGNNLSSGTKSTATELSFTDNNRERIEMAADPHQQSNSSQQPQPPPTETTEVK